METHHWWDPISVPVGGDWSMTAGQCDLRIEHDSHEWRLSATSARHPETPSALRVATARTDDLVQLHPRLETRPIVARLEVPLRIASGDRTTIYVGSPLGATVELGPPNGLMLGELRFFDAPSTWFGPNTRTGELCFASRTSGRLLAENIEHQLDRAITAIDVENKSAELLVFERVKIPVPNLSLYWSEAGTLWTNRLIVYHSDASSPTEETSTDAIEEGPPIALDLGELSELAGPREPFRPTLLERAFGALL